MEEKRQRDPRMHSAEHLLNGTMVKMFGCGRSFTAHVEKKKSKCDYHFERNLTGEEINELEARVNKIINDDLRVYEEYMEFEEAGRLFNISRLPDGVEDSVRIIRIGDYDACPCSGIHVNSSSEIGQFKIISTSHENGVLRIRYKLNA